MTNPQIHNAKALVNKVGQDALALLAKIGWSYAVVDGEGNEHSNIVKTKRRKLNDFSHHNIFDRVANSSSGDRIFFEAQEGEDLPSLQGSICATSSKLLGNKNFKTQQSKEPRGVYLQVGIRAAGVGSSLDDALAVLAKFSSAEAASV